MKRLIPTLSIFVLFVMIFSAVTMNAQNNTPQNQSKVIQNKLQDFVEISLTTDISKLTGTDKKMIPILIEIADIMDDLYWEEAFGNKDSLLNSLPDDAFKKFARLNYGPWERLNNNNPFITGVGEKPKGANFYPKNMTKEEFAKFEDVNKTSQYTLIKRNPDGSLKCVWYHEAFAQKIQKAAELLRKAATFSDDRDFANYLNRRSEALLTDDYFQSDMAWMDMKCNSIDFVVGPIENYEDELFGYKTAHESSILVKDKEWSAKLEKFSSMLPKLQTQLPVDPKYKKEKPGNSSDLNAYDIIYYSGHSNAGSKTIAINLPNDEAVQAQKGSRRLQLKNTMNAKFKYILLPISNVLIDPSQSEHVSFDAFFSNVMFHEVAHGLGVKNTINGKGLVKTALKESYSSFEEAKADVLGLFLVTKLIESGDIKDLTIEDCYITYMAGIFRSVRFGAASSHGKANMMCFNFFEDNKAFSRNADGTYKVDFEKMKLSVDKWAAKVLMIEGNGDYDAAVSYLKDNSIVRPDLQTDIDKLKTANIPVDIYFKQGVEVLGLTK